MLTKRNLIKNVAISGTLAASLIASVLSPCKILNTSAVSLQDFQAESLLEERTNRKEVMQELKAKVCGSQVQDSRQSQMSLFARLIRISFEENFAKNKNLAKEIEKIALNKNRDYAITVYTNRVINPKALKRYGGNQIFYNDATNALTAVLTFLLNTFLDDGFENKDEFLENLYHFIGNLRNDMATATGTEEKRYFGAIMGRENPRTLYDAVLFRRLTQEAKNYIERRIGMGYYERSTQLNGIHGERDNSGILICAERDNTVYVGPRITSLIKNLDASYTVKFFGVDKSIEEVEGEKCTSLLDILGHKDTWEDTKKKGVMFRTFHCPSNGCLTGESGRFEEIMQAVRDVKDNKLPKEEFKEKLLAFIWEINHESVYERGQATAFIMLIRAITKTLNFEFTQINEWGSDSSICIDVAALLTPKKQSFVRDNIDNISLE